MTKEEKYSLIHTYAWQSAEANVLELYGVSSSALCNPVLDPFYRPAYAEAIRANYTANFLQLLYLCDDEAARICDCCGQYMTVGYIADAGWAYYCSRACLHKSYVPDQWEERVREKGKEFGFRDFNPTVHQIIDRNLEELIGPSRHTEQWVQRFYLTPDMVHNVRQMERLLWEYRESEPKDETRFGNECFSQIYSLDRSRLSLTAGQDLGIDLGSLGFQLTNQDSLASMDPHRGMYSKDYLCSVTWDRERILLTYFPDADTLMHWIEWTEGIGKNLRKRVVQFLAEQTAHIK